jgi:hypothetical protein
MLLVLAIPPEGSDVIPLTLTRDTDNFTIWQRYTVDAIDTGPWALSHVCQSWRSAALECSRVWSHVAVNFSWDESPRRELMDLYLERSREHHLHVRLNSAFSWRASSQGNVLAADGAFKRLLETSGRWRSASMTLQVHEVGCLLPLKGNLGDLRMLKFTLTEGDDGQTVHFWTDVFRQLFVDTDDPEEVRLEHVMLVVQALSAWGIPANDLSTILPYQTLKSLSVSSWVSVPVVSLLPQCKSLTSLAFSGKVTLDAPVELPSVQSLDVAQMDDDCIDTVNLLTTKSLTSLTIAFSNRFALEEDVYLEQVTNLVVPGLECRALSRLTIVFSREDDLSDFSKNDLLAALFEQTPHLETLSFLGRTLYAYLNAWNEEHFAGIFYLLERSDILPQLRNLEVECHFLQQGGPYAAGGFDGVRSRGRVRMPMQFYRIMETRRPLPEEVIKVEFEPEPEPEPAARDESESSSPSTPTEQLPIILAKPKCVRLERFSWRSNLMLFIEPRDWEECKMEARTAIEPVFRIERNRISNMEVNADRIAIDHYL